MAGASSLEKDLHSLCKKHQGKVTSSFDEFTLEVKSEKIMLVLKSLRDWKEFKFEQLLDVAGVDYLEYEKTEWKTQSATNSGFSRGVNKNSFSRLTFSDDEVSTQMDQPRYAVIYHLLSIAKNIRLRVKCYCDDNDFPIMPSACGIWSSANWYEREAFDLFGIVFQGHPDMRRLLTDYGFVGHPLRKDFPLIGHVETRFDPVKKRVVYEPVSIEPRVLVPKVIRKDSRYIADAEDNK